MWIIYLVIALAISTGAGVYVSRDAQTSLQDIARTEAPQVYGEEANRIARHLRRMYQDNPTLFPSPPRPGRAPVTIPTALVNRSLVQGHNAPRGVRFVLQADGTIVAVFVPTTGPSGTLMAETVNRVIEREGGNSDLYNRLVAPDRSARFADVQPMPATALPVMRNLSTTGILVAGAGDANIPVGTETTTVPVRGYDGWTDGNDPNAGAGGGTGVTPNIPGAGQGTGSAPDGSDTARDVDPITDFEDLFEGGGSGGSVVINPDSYTVRNGQVIVNAGFETIAGPRANFYSATNLEAAVLSARTTQNPLVNRIRTLTFANPGAAGTRPSLETAFNAACRPVLQRAYANFEDRMDVFRVMVTEFNSRTNRSTNNVADDMDLIEASFLSTAMYCLGVYDARMPPYPLPVRADMAHVQNIAALNMGADIAATWINNNSLFMRATIVPARITYTNSSGGREEHVDPPIFAAEMASYKEMLAEIAEVHRVVQTYP